MNETTSISEEIMNVNNTGERSVHECVYDLLLISLLLSTVLHSRKERKCSYLNDLVPNFYGVLSNFSHIWSMINIFFGIYPVTDDRSDF